ncbi:autophagy-related protein 11-domain-containing protein [Morchella snyderi]|nr:autophagy-related protein 11-domain-containing protein [Morchella snyderi]
MPILIYTAHTGECLQAESGSFASVEELRKWIDSKISLPPACQILMTSRGTNFKPASLTQERELYLFDRRHLTHPFPPPPTSPIPRVQIPTPFPTNLDSETELSSWRSLFKKRLSWSESVLSHAQMLAQQIAEDDSATGVIRQAVKVAFSNLEYHSGTLNSSLGKLRDWAEGVLVDQDRVLAEWEDGVGVLTRLPVHPELRRYHQTGLEEEQEAKVLADFFTIKDVQIAASTLSNLSQKFEKDVIELSETIEDIVGQTQVLKGEIQREKELAERGGVAENCKMLIGEIEVLVKKVKTDYDYVLTLQGPRAISTASKRAYASTTEYLPGLVSVVGDVGRVLQEAVKLKNEASERSTAHLQTIAHIQSLCAPVNPALTSLDSTFAEDASLRLLTLITRFPSIYGSLLIECVRRREWSAKFTSDSQRVAEDLANIKEDEEKRRRKWMRNTGSLLPFNLEGGDGVQGVVRAELTTRGDASGGLPNINRADIEAFLTTLKPIEGMEGTWKELQGLYIKLDEPQTIGGRKHGGKRPKGFKFGSIHEATNTGGGSFYVSRGDEELKALRTEKEALQQRVQGYESRVRKLEDLIHRARATTGNVYTPSQTPQSASNTPQLTQQAFPNDGPTSPVNVRRISSENFVDRTRITTLEAELAAERELTARLQQEAAARAGSEKEMSERMRSADDTKRDLVANLEALGQQHIVERKAFQQEIEELKGKIEEAYEELDRDEERIKSLEGELEKTGVEVEKLRGENARLIESVRAMEESMKGMKEVLESAKKDNLERESLVGRVKGAHEKFGGETAPNDLGKLMDGIEELITKSVDRCKDLSTQLDDMKEHGDAVEKEKETLERRLESRSIKAKDLTQRLYTHNIRSIQLLEALGYRIVRNEGNTTIVKVSRSNNSDSAVLSRSSHDMSASMKKSGHLPPTTAEDISLLYWLHDSDSSAEDEAFSAYLTNISSLDLDAFADTVTSRVKKVENDCRQLMKQCRAYREKYYRSRDEANEKIAFKSFKSGDLALFLPTRNSATRPWAAFNVGAPHFFLKEETGHNLRSRDWLLARITKIEDRVVDLSRSSASIQLPPDRASLHSSDGASIDDENPFELSDGLRWYLLDAVEEKPGAPSTPGLSSSTVAAANVDVKGSLRSRKPVTGAKKTLSQITTEHSRRSSSASGRGNLHSRDGPPADVVAAVREGLEVAEVAVIEGIEKDGS